ncbi:MAG: hypothetical protein JNJ77_05895 [Planctomycetia bacterium]|nr:hypothetical protein [Planctomycetia bacterium]
MLLIIVIVLLSLPQDTKPIAELTQKDKDFLEQLFKEGLFDPYGAEWVVVIQELTPQKHVTGVHKIQTQVWKKGNEFFNMDGVGARVTFPKDVTVVPAKLEETIRLRFHPTAEEKDNWRLRRFGYPPSPPDLALAAWVYRQGKDKQAAEILASVQKEFERRSQYHNPSERFPPKDIRDTMHNDLCWWAFVGMKNALEQWKDDEVLERFHIIQKYYRGDVVTRFSQGEEVLADIARREREGTLGKPALTALPDTYKTWPLQEKCRFLIKHLEDHTSPFAGRGISEKEMVKLGESALPALFECIEKDTRLARGSQEGGIRHIPNRDRFYVSELAYQAVRQILKSIPQSNKPWEPRTRIEHIRMLGEEARKYWEASKGRPQQTRFYETLCDLKMNHHSRADALRSLLSTQHERYVQLPDANSNYTYWPEPPAQLREELASFQNPTVAQAILRSLDHDLQLKPGSNQPYDINMNARLLHSYESCFLVALIHLGDRQVIPELQQRISNTTHWRLRLKLAMTLHRFGESKPLAKLALEIAEGKQPEQAFAPVDQRTIGESWNIANLESSMLMQTLIAARLPETEKALMSFTSPTHPLYPYFASRFTYEHRGRNSDFYGHPNCLSFLRSALDDTSPSGITYRVEKNSILELSSNGRGAGSLYGELQKAELRRESAESRRCDEQMMKMREVVFGLVHYHPLFLNHQQRFDRNYQWITAQKFRSMTPHEMKQLNVHDRLVLPVLEPLKRPATKADVDALRAAFSLDGESKCIDMPLPAWMVLKQDVNNNYVNRRGIIIQAEEQQGNRRYGVLYQDGFKTIQEKEVLRIEPYEQQAAK